MFKHRVLFILLSISFLLLTGCSRGPSDKEIITALKVDEVVKSRKTVIPVKAGIQNLLK
jgi:hypothetical protein